MDDPQLGEKVDIEYFSRAPNSNLRGPYCGKNKVAGLDVAPYGKFLYSFSNGEKGEIFSKYPPLYWRWRHIPPTINIIPGQCECVRYRVTVTSSYNGNIANQDYIVYGKIRGLVKQQTVETRYNQNTGQPYDYYTTRFVIYANDGQCQPKEYVLGGGSGFGSPPDWIASITKYIRDDGLPDNCGIEETPGKYVLIFYDMKFKPYIHTLHILENEEMPAISVHCADRCPENTCACEHDDSDQVCCINENGFIVDRYLKGIYIIL